MITVVDAVDVDAATRAEEMCGCAADRKEAWAELIGCRGIELRWSELI